MFGITATDPLENAMLGAVTVPEGARTDIGKNPLETSAFLDQLKFVPL